MTKSREAPTADRDGADLAAAGERLQQDPGNGTAVAMAVGMALARLLCALAAFAAAGIAAAARAPEPAIFREDDPLTKEPETQDASAAVEWNIDLFVDLAINLFGQPGERTTGIRAANVNTIDEVPDSSWFTNRILASPLSIEEAARGPLTGSAPAAGRWTVIASKQSGAAPGFTIEDTAQNVWFISFDARGHPEAATGAILVANKIFWALGYWQVENVLTRGWPEQIVIGDAATVRTMSGGRRPMRPDDLDEVWRRAHRSEDGSFRAVAARKLPGRALGGFRYHGTRPDDPNDVIPHEHRRELRALKVFGAWTNLVDMKAGNTLDVLVEENGRTVVRHYLQDVGSTFGTGALAPHEYDEGWEHLYEGGVLLKRLVSLGFFISPWQTVDYREHSAIGRFEAVEFDPAAWKPRVPTAAIRHAQPDDLFWAARRVAAFSDEMIRALARTGMYSDPDAERHLADVLIARRDKIAAAYLTAVAPLVDFELSPEGRLSFENAAVVADVAAQPRGGYQVTWLRFDNVTGATEPIGGERIVAGERATAPGELRGAPDTLVGVRVVPIAPPHEFPAVQAYFRSNGEGWRLVGLDRHGALVPQPAQTR